MTVEMTLVESPTDADREAILNPLIAFNASHVGAAGYRRLAIHLRDDSGSTSGGLWGECYYEWLFVGLLFVPEQLRRQQFGSRLLTQAEAFARQHGCVGIWLDTFAFQAPGFYRKVGYRQFGSLDNYPKGFTRFFFCKNL